MTIGTWGVIIGILLGLGAIGKAINDYIIKPVMIKINKKKSRDQKLDEIIGSMTELKAQFYTNGGSTIKDQLNRMEVRQLFSDKTAKITVDVLGMGLYQTDKDGSRIESSPSLCKILGRSEYELRGTNWQSWIDPKHKENVIKEWNRCVKDRSEFSASYDFIRNDNKKVSVQVHAAPIIDNMTGRFVGYVGMVTEIKHNENN